MFGYLSNDLQLAIFSDLIQDLFNPVIFRDGTEARTYMMFTQFLTEAEGTH